MLGSWSRVAWGAILVTDNIENPIVRKGPIQRTLKFLLLYGGGNQRGRRSQKTCDDRRFKKAYKADIEMYACDSSSDEDDNTCVSPRAHVAVDEEYNSDGSNSVGSLAAHVACMFSSLKE